jgi:hypothetical protein
MEKYKMLSRLQFDDDGKVIVPKLCNEKYKSLDDVRKYLNGIDNINCGGCGVSALAMFRWLKKNGKEGMKIVIMYCSYEKDDYLNNQEVLRNGSGIAKAPAHCCIFYDGQFLDSKEHACDMSRYGWFQMIDDDTFMKRLINDDVKSWNSMFDRKYVKEIENELGVSWEEVKK